jgi:hypothetical protein
VYVRGVYKKKEKRDGRGIEGLDIGGGVKCRSVCD